MSNTERQRRFRQRNPGYYGRLHRKRNLPWGEQHPVMAMAATAHVPLALPAPVEAVTEPIAVAVAVPVSQQVDEWTQFWQDAARFRERQAELVAVRRD